MGEHEVQQAVHAMAVDEELRTAVAGGDLSGLDGELSDEEQAMVIAAAADFPDVAGFAFDLGFATTYKFPCTAAVKGDRPVNRCGTKCSPPAVPKP